MRNKLGNSLKNDKKYTWNFLYRILGKFSGIKFKMD